MASILRVRREILVFDFRGKVAVAGLERVERCSGSGNFPLFLLIEGEKVTEVGALLICIRQGNWLLNCINW